jgi:transaldolase
MHAHERPFLRQQARRCCPDAARSTGYENALSSQTQIHVYGLRLAASLDGLARGSNGPFSLLVFARQKPNYARHPKPQQEEAMKFFIDTAEVSEIREAAMTGLVDGVTTNPSLIAKSGRNFLEVVAEICALVPGPVSAEVTANDFDTMLKEGRKLAKIAKNVAVKVPLTVDGLKTCYALANEGTKVNVTLCFSAAQALLAAKAGATYISPFVGRLDDIGTNGLELIADICTIYRQYPNLKTEVLVASVRHPVHIVESAKLGAHVATMPPATLKQLFNHPLTDKGLAQFNADWKKTSQSIL